MLVSSVKVAVIIAFLIAPQASIAAHPLFFGQVNDTSGGREPIDDAVVSLELFTSPKGMTASNALPTRLAVWQTRSSFGGRFLMHAGSDSLELPAGTVLSKARLRVFAFGYEDGFSGEAFREITLTSSSLGGRRIRVGSSGEQSTWLILRPQARQSYFSQLDSWYAEITEGVHSGAWPNVDQAVQSYAPLLMLLDSSCRLVQGIFGDSPSGCQAAWREFDLSNLSLEQPTVQPVTSPPRSIRDLSQVPIRTGKPEAPMEALMRQEPPDDKSDD